MADTAHPSKRYAKPLGGSYKDKYVDSQRFDSLPNMVAVIGSVIFLTCLPMFLYLALIFATNDPGGPLNLILIPCSNLFAAIVFTVIFSYPLSRLWDRLLVNASQNRQRKIVLHVLTALGGLGWVLVCGGFAIAMGVVLKVPWLLQVLDTQADAVMVGLIRVLFWGGIPILIGGTTYWLFFQASRRLLSNRHGEQELRDNPKAS